MTFVPAHEAHAIDKAAAAVVFSEPVSSDAWIPLLVKTAEIGRERDFSSAMEGVSAGLTLANPAGGVPTVTTQLFSAGIGFKKTADGGAPLFDMMVQRNEVRIESHAYVRWSGFRELVLDLLPPILGAFPPDWPVAQIKLEYWDRFVSPDGRASWAEVIRADGRLPAWVTESQTDWHSHVGWFDQAGARQRLINVNVDTLNEANEKGEQIQTVRIHTLTATVERLEAANAVSKSIAAQIDELHLLSKVTVRDVLSASMAERISLFERG